MQIRPRQLIFNVVAGFAALVLTASSSAAQRDRLALTSNVIWSQPDTWFGGFSGAEVSRNGTLITLVSDKGSLVTATMIRQGGQLVALQQRGRFAIRSIHGDLLQGKGTDAEGLAMDTRNRAYVSFEHNHRVTRLNLATGQIDQVLPTAAFAGFQANSGLEALAIDPRGTLYTLPERSGGKRAPFPLFAFTDGRWTVRHHLPRRGPFLPVGADFADDGSLYLLERAVTPLGFRSRIRRFDLTAPDLGEQTLLTTGAGQFDNLEALSVWQDTAGQTRLTLISDDNFLAIQRTQIVEFSLVPGLAPSPQKP